MKPLILIPARGGSKGVPGKNSKKLNGKPLIHYTIEAAVALFEKKLICVSTDSIQIKDVAVTAGIEVPFIRPAELALDTSGSYEVIMHALAFYEDRGYNPDVLILLQPTSPFRNSGHIAAALELYESKTDVDMVVSVKEAKANPYYNLFEEDANGFLSKSKAADFIRRQDCPKIWEYNGAIYIINVASLKAGPVHTFKKIVKYEMDEFSSHDIDTPFDWKMAELMTDKNTINEN